MDEGEAADPAWRRTHGSPADQREPGSRAEAGQDGAAIGVTRCREARSVFGAIFRGVPVPRWPPLIELATALTCGLIAWRYTGELTSVRELSMLGACLYLVIAGVALTLIDWRTKRLPDAITLPSYPIVLGLLIPSGELPHALYGMLALGVIYAILWFARPAGLGLGDVKLAGLIGLVAGALGPHGWVVAAIGGHLLGAVYATGLLITRKGTLTSEFPFGPFMLAATLVAVLVTG